MRIGVDLMGSDSSPEVIFRGVCEAALEIGLPHSFLLFCNQETHMELRASYPELIEKRGAPQIEFAFVSEFITMLDEPLTAIRSKKNSSLVQGLRFLKKKQIDAFVSAGNTGALVAASTLILPLLKGVRRPALLALLPTEVGHMAVLDVGGNVQLKGENLIRFAELGAAFKRVQEGVAAPRVGLLNVGVESKKGTQEHRHAYECLQNLSKTYTGLKFIGNIEARNIFRGDVDVLVTDGFTGNVLLKTTEGMAFFMLDFLKKSQPKNGIDMHDLVQIFLKQFSYTEYPGAILLGVDGIVVKCHGESTSKSLFHGIKAAFSYAKNRLIERIKEDRASIAPTY